MRRIQDKYIRIIFIGVILLITNACSNTYVEDIKRGAGYEYQPGFPELRLEVAGIIDQDGNPKIQVAGSIPHGSLVFKNNEGSLQAEITISYDIENVTTGQFQTINQTETITKAPESSAFDDDLFLFEREFEVAPGSFNITSAVTDQSSNKTIIRKAEAFIPNPKNEISNITNIQILAKYEESDYEFFPVTTYDVNSSTDSIKFVFQVTNHKRDEPITFNARLIRFESDTSIAKPMSFSNYSTSSLPYKGIEYDNYEIIQSSQRELNQPGNVTIEFAFETLERGNYRFEVAPDLNKKGALYKARDFSIKSPNYPSVKSTRELARPLVYLMGKNEYEDLMKISSDDSLKMAIDRFWLENIQNSARAKSVISLYYERVEEANKLFSTFKEGWKTDIGMIYILLGPPLDEYRRLRGVRWSYKYNQLDPEYTFYFRITKTKTEHYPFDNYILQRENYYFRVEYRIRELWLSGSIINREI